MSNIRKLRRLGQGNEPERRDEQNTGGHLIGLQMCWCGHLPRHIRFLYMLLLHCRRSRRESTRERHDSSCGSKPAHGVQVPAVRRKHPDGKKVALGWARAESCFSALDKCPLCQLFALCSFCQRAPGLCWIFFLYYILWGCTYASIWKTIRI